MSFSRPQQGLFRPLLASAWQAMCKHEGLDPTARCRSGKRCGACAFCEWYEAELREAVGVASTVDLDVKRDFERVMRHFAEIAGDLYWMTRIDGADARRLQANVRAVCAQRDFDEDYIRGGAKKALKLEELPQLEDLTYEQLATVLSALKSKARHFRDWTPDQGRARVEEPF